ncbi:MAG: DUF86 domain-containing protein [Verrucomicrobia bacterium]|nr:DUF86 domain-containing protein [Verrucomicrobiota bacterium]
MSPEVYRRKQALLCKYLERLSRHEYLDPAGYDAVRYEVERLLVLLLEISADMMAHELKRLNIEVPETYRGIFTEAAKAKLMDDELAESLRKASGQRNILTHLYEDIDDNMILSTIPHALSTYKEVLDASEEWAKE